MSDKPHLGSYRGNAFEASLIQLGPNQIGVKASEWSAAASKPPDLVLVDTDFTADEMTQHHAYWAMVEKKYEAKYLAFKKTPEAAHAATQQWLDAQKALDDIGKRHAAMDTQLALKQAALEQMTAQHEDIVAKVVEMTASLAAGTAEAHDNG